MLIQEFFFPGHIKDIVLMLAEAGQNLPFRAGKGKPDTPGRIQEILLPFREGDDLAVRRLADFRFTGFPQAVHRPRFAFKRGQGQEVRSAVGKDDRRRKRRVLRTQPNAGDSLTDFLPFHSIASL